MYQATSADDRILDRQQQRRWLPSLLRWCGVLTITVLNRQQQRRPGDSGRWRKLGHDEPAPSPGNGGGVFYQGLARPALIDDGVAIKSTDHRQRVTIFPADGGGLSIFGCRQAAVTLACATRFAHSGRSFGLRPRSVDDSTAGCPGRRHRPRWHRRVRSFRRRAAPRLPLRDLRGHCPRHRGTGTGAVCWASVVQAAGCRHAVVGGAGSQRHGQGDERSGERHGVLPVTGPWHLPLLSGSHTPASRTHNEPVRLATTLYQVSVMPALNEFMICFSPSHQRVSARK